MGSTKVAITLPEDLYWRVEKLRKRAHTSRSAVVQRALVLLLKDSQKQERVRAYIEGYKQDPETDKEIRTVEASAIQLLSEVPWE